MPDNFLSARHRAVRLLQQNDRDIAQAQAVLKLALARWRTSSVGKGDGDA